MVRLKIRLFMTKYRFLIIVAFAITLIGIIIWGVSKIDSNIIIGDSTLFGVIGTLLGAIIGGVFSLMGSVWVNSRQQRALQNIKRKNVIYSPLYDELIEIQNIILQQNPYPNYISFKKDQQTILPHPQFSAWGRIKTDTRYLDVPSILVNQMEQLEETIHNYQLVRHTADEEIRNVLNSVLIGNNLRPSNIVNIGSVISGDILARNSIDILNKYSIPENEDSNIGKFTREKILYEIYRKCDNVQTVIEIRKRYEEWLNIQEKTIEILSILIKQVLLQYEG